MQWVELVLAQMGLDQKLAFSVWQQWPSLFAVRSALKRLSMILSSSQLSPDKPLLTISHISGCNLLSKTDSNSPPRYLTDAQRAFNSQTWASTVADLKNLKGGASWSVE